MSTTSIGQLWGKQRVVREAFLSRRRDVVSLQSSLVTLPRTRERPVLDEVYSLPDASTTSETLGRAFDCCKIAEETCESNPPPADILLHAACYCFAPYGPLSFR